MKRIKWITIPASSAANGGISGRNVAAFPVGAEILLVAMPEKPWLVAFRIRYEEGSLEEKRAFLALSTDVRDDFAVQLHPRHSYISTVQCGVRYYDIVEIL